MANKHEQFLKMKKLRNTAIEKRKWQQPFAAAFQFLNSSIAQCLQLSIIGTLLLLTQAAQAQIEDECGSFSNILTARISVVGAAANSTGPYCLGQTIQLVGMGGDTYQWSGPNGFTSTEQSPMIANGNFVNSGTYRLTVWDTLGCSDVATVKIIFKACIEDCHNGFDDDLDGLTDCADPSCKLDSLAIGIVGDSVFCAGGSSQLTASQGVAWLWSTGETSQTITADSTGNFKITATNAQGCTAVDSFSIKVNPKPEAAASVGGLICEEQTIRFAASGGSFYHWTGPNGLEMHRDTFDLNYLKVVQGGVYQVIVRNSFGCADTVKVPVPVSFNPGDMAAVGGMITCLDSCLNLAANTSLVGANFEWAGPNGFSSNLQNPKVCETGIYYLTITDPATGCFSTDTALVSRNDTSFTVNCKVASNITCLRDSGIIEITTSIENYHVFISGPDGYIQQGSKAPAGKAGDYTAVVTNLASGCQVSCVVNVQLDTLQPIAIAWAEKLSCTGPGCQVFCNASQPGVKYFWTGPGGFASADQNPMVYQVGRYQVKIQGTESSCWSDEQEVEVKLE